MWLIVLSDQLPIVALVGHYPTNELIGHGPLFQRPLRSFALGCDTREHMRYCRRFLAGIPHWKAGHPCVTHPSATPSLRKARACDLHVLGTPPAFVLSQDQTRRSLLIAISPRWCIWLKSRELTETASANSCCSVFHSSVVKVPAQYVVHTAISWVEINVHRGPPREGKASPTLVCL